MIKELLFYMKYCPNCGKEMSGEFCSNCGYPKSNNTTINRDELLNAYASKNANKVYNRSWNWSAFLFAPVYYLYRKMWIEGLILLILNYIVNNFISNGIVSFILVIVIGVVASLLLIILVFKLNALPLLYTMVLIGIVVLLALISFLLMKPSKTSGKGKIRNIIGKSSDHSE